MEYSKVFMENLILTILFNILAHLPNFWFSKDDEAQGYTCTQFGEFKSFVSSWSNLYI